MILETPKGDDLSRDPGEAVNRLWEQTQKGG
jgi:hypothetical protein